MSWLRASVLACAAALCVAQQQCLIANNVDEQVDSPVPSSVPNAVVLMDADRDGDNDIVSVGVSRDSLNAARVHDYDADFLTFSPNVATWTQQVHTGRINRLRSADVDGDGFVSELVASSADAVSWSMMTRTAGAIALQQVAIVTSSPSTVVDILVGPLDSGLTDDVLVVTQSTITAVYFTDGSAAQTQRPVGTSASNSFTAAATCDINGDGRVDVVAVERTSAVLRLARVLLFRGTSAGFVSSELIAAVNASTAVACLAFDADTRLDVVTGSDDGVVWHRNVGTSTSAAFAPAELVYATPAARMFVLDGDGDGDTDVFAASSGAASLAYVERVTPTEFAAHTVPGVGVGAALTVGSIDGNELVDVIVGGVSGADPFRWISNACVNTNLCFPPTTVDPAIAGVDNSVAFRSAVADLGASPCVRRCV
jgi:hypothetical protein